MPQQCIKFFVGDIAYLDDLTPVIIQEMRSISGDVDYFSNGIKYDEEDLHTFSEAADLKAQELAEELMEL